MVVAGGGYARERLILVLIRIGVRWDRGERVKKKRKAEKETENTSRDIKDKREGSAAIRDRAARSGGGEASRVNRVVREEDPRGR